MASMNQEKMVEELSSWTVMEVAGLIKALEEKWGVKAAPAAVAVAAGPAAAPAAAAVEQTEFLVELTNAIPNLIDIQKRSYEKFLQANIPQHEREDIGLQGVFRSVFPIRDFNGTSELVFVGYTLERPSTTSTSAASAA
jgi:hypothetical protein